MRQPVARSHHFHNAPAAINAGKDGAGGAGGAERGRRAQQLKGAGAPRACAVSAVGALWGRPWYSVMVGIPACSRTEEESDSLFIPC